MKITLSDSQLDKLADLCIGLGQLFFGSTVIPFIVPSIDKPTVLVLLFGLVVAIGFWIFAIWFVKGVKL